jgi:hypothetical protein
MEAFARIHLFELASTGSNHGLEKSLLCGEALQDCHERPLMHNSTIAEVLRSHCRHSFVADTHQSHLSENVTIG